jgi:hypothetical protein
MPSRSSRASCPSSRATTDVQFPFMVEKARFWWTLLVAWLVNVLPAVPHAEDPRPTILRIAQDHDPDAESEQPSASHAQLQGTEIAPPPAPMPPSRGMTWAMDSDAPYWGSHAALQICLPQNRGIAAFLATPQPPPAGGLPAVKLH